MQKTSQELQGKKKQKNEDYASEVRHNCQLTICCRRLSAARCAAASSLSSLAVRCGCFAAVDFRDGAAAPVRASAAPAGAETCALFDGTPAVAGALVLEALTAAHSSVQGSSVSGVFTSYDAGRPAADSAA